MEAIYHLRRDYLTLEPVTDLCAFPERHGALVVARAGRWVEVRHTGGYPGGHGGYVPTVEDTGRSWPMGDLGGTGAAVIDGVTYRVCATVR